jgi:hypothetical protein
MLLCEDVRPDPGNPKKLDILGLISTVQGAEGATFPLQLPVLCVYLAVSGGRGSGQTRIDVRQADSGNLVFASRSHLIVFPSDPLAVRGVVFRIRNCVFQEPGLYWVQFCYNDQKLAEQSLVVR